MIPSRSQWKQWSLPSKLTAIGTLVGALSLGLYLGEKSLRVFSPSFRPTVPESLAIPAVALALENPTDQPVAIQRRGDFVLWLPQGVDGVRRLPGKYDFEAPDGQSSSPVVVIRPRATVPVVAHLRAEIPLAQLLDRRAADLEFILRKERGGLLFSGSIPFTREATKATRWKIDLARRE